MKEGIKLHYIFETEDFKNSDNPYILKFIKHIDLNYINIFKDIISILLLTISIIITFFVSVMLIGTAKEQEKNRKVDKTIPVFSAIISLVALIISLIALVK